ncbi:MAG: outer membrane lipoprotein carrier protein LolA [Alphaproteobacteria bacterium]|nr:outer membrane lipoprotein carrier protein LolA [Alphaproteobacteria bacterium]
MRYFLTLFLTFSLAIFFFGGPALAALSDQDKADVKKAEAYLQALTSARARFVQTTHDGTQLVGTFYLQRPGKLRFEYDPPIEDFVVADGIFIYFYDAELGEQTNAPIGQTLADFFLRKNVALGGDVKVDEIKRAGDYLQIKLVQADDPAAGSITLGFKEDPFTLSKWRVVDGQGLITEVELFYLKTDIKHPRNLFVYANPDSGKPKYNK